MKVVMLSPPSEYGDAVVRDTLYGCWCKGRVKYMWPPIGLALFASVLEEKGHEVRIIDAPAEGKKLGEIIKNIQSFSANAVLVNTETLTFAEDIQILEGIKSELKDIKVILTGPHVTALPEKSLNYAIVDFIATGGCELTIGELIDALEHDGNYDSIKGIGFKKDGKNCITEERELIKNLDDLPFPARHLIPDVEYFNPLAKRLPYTTMMTSRGCPFKCIYCTTVPFYKGKTRLRSAENVVEEMEQITKLGIKEIMIRDETFTLSKKRVLKICQLIKEKGLDISWICNTRVDTVDYEMLNAMKDAGCHTIKFGVESGNQKILDTLKKGISLDDTKTAFKLCKKFGIRTVAHFMLGSPGETSETLKQTINFVMDLDPDFASPNITTPYPGTELFDLIRDKGFDEEKWRDWNLSSVKEGAVFNELFADVTNEELEKAFVTFYRKFYYRPSYIFKRVAGIRSFDELRRVVIAAISMFDFVKSKSREN